MKHSRRIISIFLAITMILLFLPLAGADGLPEQQNAAAAKISAELRDRMETSSPEDLIPVYLWLKDINEDVINQALFAETGFDNAVYQDPDRFDAEIVPQITARVVAELGDEAARYVDPEWGVSPIDTAISENVDEYIMARRGIVKRMYSAVNDKFIADNIGEKPRAIIYNSRYTSTLTVEATKSEIMAYAMMGIVEEITLYVELIPEPELNISLGQVGADSSSGTKSASYNGGNGYKGTGIKIGIIEAGGRFDPSAAQLSSIPSTRLIYANDAGLLGTPIIPGASITDHATKVTEIIVGQSVTVSGRTLEGVVPLATVYQTPTNNIADVHRAIQKLADKGCAVINYSGGIPGDIELYTSHDMEVDKLIRSTKVTFVNSAGNETSGNVTSPGKAFNAITVGNAFTISDVFAATTTPYGLHSTSSYKESPYLPNKPDIVAPGTNINVGSTSGYLLPRMSGTSFSAPHVTGIVAQIMQATSVAKGNPTLAKAILLLGADASKMTTDPNNPTAGNPYLRDRSGSGLANSKNAISSALSSYRGSSSIISTAGYTTASRAFNAGQKIRIVMVFEKVHPGVVSSYAEIDDIDLLIISSATGNQVASSASTKNNVEIIEYTFTASGNYVFKINPYMIRNYDQEIRVAFSWKFM